MPAEVMIEKSTPETPQPDSVIGGPGVPGFPPETPPESPRPEGAPPEPAATPTPTPPAPPGPTYRFKSQADAEKAHNSLYGRFSESQKQAKLVDELKAALDDPEALAQYMQDPKLRPILEKLGFEKVREEPATSGFRVPKYSTRIPTSISALPHNR